VLSLRGGGPKKDKGKGKGKGKDKGKGKGEGKAPLAEGEEMSEEQLKETIAHLRSELDHEREERNYFQLERDKINTFWEISKKELEDRKAELRNKDREMEELEERHQVSDPDPAPALAQHAHAAMLLPLLLLLLRRWRSVGGCRVDVSCAAVAGGCGCGSMRSTGWRLQPWRVARSSQRGHAVPPLATLLLRCCCVPGVSRALR